MTDETASAEGDVPASRALDVAGESDAWESADASAVGAEDFYMDGPYLVFTAAYHRKRGYCCNSNCRHCPYHDEA